MIESTTCPACGEVLPARAVFCRTCGFRLQPTEQPLPAQPQPGLDPAEQEAPALPQPEENAPPEQDFNASAQFASEKSPEGLTSVPENASTEAAGFDTSSEDASTLPTGLDSTPTDFEAAPPAQLNTPSEDYITSLASLGAPPVRAGAAARSRAPGAWVAPPRKKRRTGLLVLIAALLLVIIAGGLLGVVVLNQKHLLGSKPPAPTSTPRPTLTPTPNRTRGFFQFSNQKYSLLYPGGWAALPAQSLSKDDEEFIASPQEMFQVQVITQAGGQPTPKLVDDVTCQTFFGPKNTPDAPTMVSIANQQWTRETCEGMVNGTMQQVLTESVVYQNQVFTLFYNAPATTFASDQQQYFTPMEQSFTFLM